MKHIQLIEIEDPDTHKIKVVEEKEVSTDEDSNEKFSNESPHSELEQEEENDFVMLRSFLAVLNIKFPTTKEMVIWVAKNYIIFALIQVLNSKYSTKDKVCIYDTLTNCFENVILPNITSWGVNILGLAFFYSGVIILSMIGKFSKFVIVYVVWNLFNIIKNKNAGDFGNYSYFVGEWMVYLVGIFTFFFLLVVLLGWISRKLPVIVFLSVFMCLGYAGNLVYEKFATNCDGWYHGLGEKNVVDNFRSCRIEKPRFCYFDFFDGIMDFSKHAGYECSKASVSSELLRRKLPSTPFVGFPRMEGLFFEDKLFWNYPRAFMNNLVPLNSLDDPKAANLEIILDKTDSSNPKLLIDVKRNEELAQQRSKVTSNPIAKNVIAIYVDALSRRSALRNLPKSMKFFEDSIDNKSEKAETYQFFKYHGITPWTFHVHLAMMYGMDAGNVDPYSLTRDLPKPEKPYRHFVSDFKEQGYITARSMTLCHQSGLYTPDEDYKYFVDEMSFDHEGSNFACDPHYHDYDKPYLYYQGSNAHIRRCLYGKDANEYNFEYGEKFWNAYPDQKKLLWLHFFDAHEGTQSVIKHLDNPLSGFLNKLQSAGKLDDTVIMLVSDHGLHEYLFDIAPLFASTKIERALPALFLRLPKDISKEYEANLIESQQTLVSAFDVHNFMRAIPNGKTSEFVESSLLGNGKHGKTCQEIDVHGQECYCK